MPAGAGLYPLLALTLALTFAWTMACSSSDPVDGIGDSTPAATDSDVAIVGIPRYTYDIVNTYPHDTSAFTQGLVYAGGYLYESTGRYGESSLRKVELSSGRVTQRREVSDEFFAEGIGLVGDRIVQLTFREHVAFVYDRDSFDRVGEFAYATEGWGLTHDGDRYIMSDGTPHLYFRDTATFAEIGRIEVTHDGNRLDNLNELEYIQGEVFANIWMTDLIARIDPASGDVLGWIDLRGMLAPGERDDDGVLNGIAYDEDNDRLFVTGKWWPWLFEIRLKETTDR